MIQNKLSRLADEIGELQGRLRLVADDASDTLAKELHAAADLLDAADRLLNKAGVRASRKSNAVPLATVAEPVQLSLFGVAS